MRRKLTTYTRRWQKLLGLGDWTVRIVFSDKRDKHPDTMATSASYWEYRDGTIHYYLPSIEGSTDFELERIAVHELLHMVVGEMRTDEKAQHEERVVTALSDSFLRLKHGK